MNKSAPTRDEGAAGQDERALTYRVLRYTPNLVRGEWVNIGVLLFDERTGERRLRLIEEEGEFRRVRRLHPDADEAVLRGLREALQDRFDSTQTSLGEPLSWQQALTKWDDTLSNVLELASPKGVLADDLDTELERLYADKVAVTGLGTRAELPGSRATMRSYCSQVFRQARLWGHLDKAVRTEEYTFPGDPMRLDYSYRSNGTRGFVQTISVTRAPADAKLLAYTVQRIQAKSSLHTEFAAVTDVPLVPEQSERHAFVRDTLREMNIVPVPLEGFAVWVAKLRPRLQQN